MLNILLNVLKEKFAKHRSNYWVPWSCLMADDFTKSGNSLDTSALVQSPDCHLTIGFSTCSSGTSFLKTLLHTCKCFQKEQEFFLPILVALDINCTLPRVQQIFFVFKLLHKLLIILQLQQFHLKMQWNAFGFH